MEKIWTFFKQDLGNLGAFNKPEIKEVRELYDLYVKYEGAYYKNPDDAARLIKGLQKIGSDADG